MALAFNGYPRMDVESLLFDIKDILRTSLQVNKAQNAEIARLGGKPINDIMAAEYDERVNLALTQVDAALDVFDSESFEAASTHYEFDIAAWIQNTNKSLGLQFESEPTAADAVDFTSDVDTASAPMSTAQDIPNDFWNVNTFKWDEEPLSDDGSGSNPDNFNTFEREETPERDDDDVFTTNGLVPEEQIPEMWLDGTNSDRSSDTPRASNSNFDDSATLYHPEDSSPTFLSHRRRHTLVGGKFASFVSHPASAALVGKGKVQTIFTSPHTAAVSTPTRPFGLVRTSSAPDLRALRGTHDLLLEEDEPMLISAF
ncbi:hypothetical protein BKA62DRAFT_697872 [Auriculariales sp. MPI-PUGE-AT-0066]|nr:hypothetical protein BKA62DRAFT_697872 [Auriculariales sp. MPI-PUGE-AT-0066]